MQVQPTPQFSNGVDSWGKCSWSPRPCEGHLMGQAGSRITKESSHLSPPLSLIKSRTPCSCSSQSPAEAGSRVPPCSGQPGTAAPGERQMHGMFVSASNVSGEKFAAPYLPLLPTQWLQLHRNCWAQPKMVAVNEPLLPASVPCLLERKGSATASLLCHPRSTPGSSHIKAI